VIVLYVNTAMLRCSPSQSENSMLSCLSVIQRLDSLNLKTRKPSLVYRSLNSFIYNQARGGCAPRGGCVTVGTGCRPFGRKAFSMSSSFHFQRKTTCSLLVSSSQSSIRLIRSSLDLTRKFLRVWRESLLKKHSIRFNHEA